MIKQLTNLSQKTTKIYLLINYLIKTTHFKKNCRNIVRFHCKINQKSGISIKISAYAGNLPENFGNRWELAGKRPSFLVSTLDFLPS